MKLEKELNKIDKRLQEFGSLLNELNEIEHQLSFGSPFHCKFCGIVHENIGYVTEYSDRHKTNCPRFLPAGAGAAAGAGAGAGAAAPSANEVASAKLLAAAEAEVSIAGVPEVLTDAGEITDADLLQAAKDAAAAATTSSISCSSCGQIGHMKNHVRCPNYSLYVKERQIRLQREQENRLAVIADKRQKTRERRETATLPPAFRGSKAPPDPNKCPECQQSHRYCTCEEEKSNEGFDERRRRLFRERSDASRAGAGAGAGFRGKPSVFSSAGAKKRKSSEIEIEDDDVEVIEATTLEERLAKGAETAIDLTGDDDEPERKKPRTGAGSGAGAGAGAGSGSHN